MNFPQSTFSLEKKVRAQEPWLSFGSLQVASMVVLSSTAVIASLGLVVGATFEISQRSCGQTKPSLCWFYHSLALVDAWLKPRYWYSWIDLLRLEARYHNIYSILGSKIWQLQVQELWQVDWSLLLFDSFVLAVNRWITIQECNHWISCSMLLHMDQKGTLYLTLCHLFPSSW